MVVTLDSTIDDPLVFDGPGLRVYVGKNRPSHRARDIFRVERNFVSNVLIEERPDVVHAHWTYEFALGALASRLPALVTVHDWAPFVFRMKPDAYRAVRWAVNDWVLSRGKWFSAVSPYIQQRLGPRLTASLTPNGLEDEAFSDASRTFARRPSLLSINQGFSRLKNVTTLLQAFAQVRQVYPAAELVLIGYDYEEGGAAARWAAQRELTKGVRFQGAVSPSEVPRFLSHADLVVHPSLQESFGMVVLEAMAQRVPVVGGRSSGGVPWLLDDGKVGVLADIHNDENLAESIVETLARPGELERLAELAYERAQRFRIDRVRTSYESLYVRIAEAEAN